MSNILVDAIFEALEAEQVEAPEDAEPISAPKLLNQVSQLIARYLQCSEHERTVLTLWVLHTYCLEAAQVTPYLYIHSAQKQSGKTLCLQLLNLLCDHAALTSGFTVSLLTRRLDGFISALLLDDCHATLGTRARSKNPAMQAILAGGFHVGLGYSGPSCERTIFRPKAFAGMGGLPEALADRSIPIFLEPLNPKSKTQRLRIFQVQEEAKLLRYQLRDWSREHRATLKEQPPYEDKHFPSDISPRRRDLIEPLLQLADYVGGRWPKRIREALEAIFEQAATREMQPSLQLLADVRDCFSHHAYPERLSTSALLEWMHSLPSRPWDVDGPISATRLSRLLFRFEIHPRNQRIGSENPARGYQREDFQEAWRLHLGVNLPDKDPSLTSPGLAELCCGQIDRGSPGLQAGEEVAPLNERRFSASGKRQKPEVDHSQFPNNDGPCNTLRLAAESESGAHDAEVDSKPTLSPGDDFIATQRAKIEGIRQRVADINAKLARLRSTSGCDKPQTQSAIGHNG